MILIGFGRLSSCAGPRKGVGRQLPDGRFHSPAVQLQSTVPRFVSHPATRRDSTTAPPLTAFSVRKIHGISIARMKWPDPFHRAGLAPDTPGSWPLLERGWYGNPPIVGAVVRRLLWPVHVLGCLHRPR